MSSQVLVATYSCQSVFKVPKGIDLYDKSKVEHFWVKWDTLYIKYVGKEEEEKIEPKMSASDEDFKYADKEEVEDADNYDFLSDEDEEDEDEEEN